MRNGETVVPAARPRQLATFKVLCVPVSTANSIFVYEIPCFPILAYEFLTRDLSMEEVSGK